MNKIEIKIILQGQVEMLRSLISEYRQEIGQKWYSNIAYSIGSLEQSIKELDKIKS
jgi:hypothetical protein